MPDFDLPAVDGDRVRKADFVGRRPLLLAFASFT
jgi:peroxiredoxin